MGERLVQAVVGLLRGGAALRGAVVEHPAGQRRLGHGRQARVPRQVGHALGGVVHGAARALDPRVGGRGVVGGRGRDHAPVGQVARAHLGVVGRVLRDPRVDVGAVHVGVHLVVAADAAVRDDPRVACGRAVGRQVVVVDAHLEAAQVRRLRVVDVGRAHLEGVDARVGGRRGAHRLVGVEPPFACRLVPPVLLERHLHAGDSALVELLDAVAVRVLEHRVAHEALRRVHEAERDRVARRVAGRAVAVDRVVGPAALHGRGGLERGGLVLAVQRDGVVVAVVVERRVRVHVRRGLQVAVRLALVEVLRLHDVAPVRGHEERERPVGGRHGHGGISVGVERGVLRHLVGRGVVLVHAHAHVGQARLGLLAVGTLLVEPAVDRRGLGRAALEDVVAPRQAAVAHGHAHAHVVGHRGGVVGGRPGLVDGLHLERLGRDGERRRPVVGRLTLDGEAHRLARVEARARLEFRRRVVAVPIGEGVAQAVLRHGRGPGALDRARGGEVGEREVARVAVVVALGDVGIGAARRGHDGASLVVEQGLARLGVALHPEAAVLLAHALDEPHGLAVAVDGQAELVEQLHLHAVDAGVVGRAVVVEVLELGAALEALARVGVGAREQAAPVGARAVVLGAVDGVVGQAVPVGVVPHVVADVAAARGRVHVGAGLAVLFDEDVFTRVGLVACLHQEGIPLHHVGDIGGRRLGIGGRIAHVHLDVQRRPHRAYQIEAFVRMRLHGSIGLRPNGAHAFEQAFFLVGVRRHIRFHLGKRHEAFRLELGGVVIAFGYPKLARFAIGQATGIGQIGRRARPQNAAAVVEKRRHVDRALFVVEHAIRLAVHAVGGCVDP